MTRRLVLCAVAVAAALGACGGDEPSGTAAPATSTTAPACSAEEPQQIDPGSSQHLLPGSPEPTFNTDPPTSGPHKPGKHPTGVLTEPMEKAVQVALLEGGEVLVQYRDAGAAGQLASLVAPGNHVTVAPNDTLPAPIVATAWLYMQRCERVDLAALRNFIALRAGKTEGH